MTASRLHRARRLRRKVCAQVSNLHKCGQSNCTYSSRCNYPSLIPYQLKDFLRLVGCSFFSRRYQTTVTFLYFFLFIYKLFLQFCLITLLEKVPKTIVDALTFGNNNVSPSEASFKGATSRHFKLFFFLGR